MSVTVDYAHGSEAYTLFEHCRRAIEKGATQGTHGLPLMGTGDWNDGMNRVGEKGEGESVWLAWFLCDVLKRFANLCESIYTAGADNAPIVVLPAASGEAPLDLAAAYRQQAQDYAVQVEQSAWDGAWYRRAYYDDGAPLGSARSSECQNRLDCPILVRAKRRGRTQTRPPGDAVGARSPGAPRRPPDPAFHPALRPDPARPRVHQRLPARNPRERRAVHPRRHLDRLGLHHPGRRRSGRGAVRPAQPGLPGRFTPRRPPNTG